MNTAVLSDLELVAALRESEARITVERIAQTDLIAEIKSRNLWAEHGCASLVVFLREQLRISASDAKTRERVTEDVGPRRTLTGEALPPVLQLTAESWRAGRISGEHVRAVAREIDALPHEVAKQLFESGQETILEAALVQVAERYDPTTAGKQMRRVRAHFDAQGMYDEAELREQQRGVSLRRNPDGSGTVTGNLTPQLAETLDTVFDALAAPTAGPDGERDPRSAAQRRHDALLAIAQHWLSNRDTPSHAGARTTVVLTMSADDFATDGQGSTGTALATTGHGYAIPVDLAKRWLEPEARAILVLLSSTKGIEAYSHTARLFSESQRLAMFARDGGCSFPGCDTAAARCEAHHLTDWAHTGRTCVDDGALACKPNHRMFERAGWTSTVLRGIPHWIPPAKIDPRRRPRRNTMHPAVALTPW